MARFRNYNWNLNAAEDNKNAAASLNDVTHALLMDIRDELQRLNNVFTCPNFVPIPRVLRKIRANTSRLPTIARPRAKRKK